MRLCFSTDFNAAWAAVGWPQRSVCPGARPSPRLPRACSKARQAPSMPLGLGPARAPEGIQEPAVIRPDVSTGRDMGGNAGGCFSPAMVRIWEKVCRYRHAVAGLEVGPAHVFRGHAFSIPGTSRACARGTPPDLPVLDGPAPTDRRVTGRQGLGARAGSKSLAWAPLSQRHGAFAQESRARLSLRRRYPRRYRRVRRSSGLLGAAGAGLQLLLGPGTSGVDVTILFSVLDAEASWPRSTRGAPSARPSPPCASPSHPARPTHGSRTFPPLRTAHAPPCTPRFHLTPFSPCVHRSSMLPFYLDQGRGRRAEAAQRLRGGPCGPGGRLGAQGGRGGGRWGAPRPPPRRPAMGQKGPPHTDSFFFQAT